MKKLNYSKINEKYLELRKEALVNVGDVHKGLLEAVEGSERKIIVLDDDPTGVQAVHGIYVFTDFKKETIAEGFAGKDKMFFLLTNSRALTQEQTTALHTEIAENVMAVSKEMGIPFLLVSRGDSTLRGHFPLETEVLKEVIEEKGELSFNGEILVPFFAAGGRFTVDNIHYVKYGEELIPAGDTEFAKDKTFGYQSSDLRMYIEEKTKGRFISWEVTEISLESLRKGDIDFIEKQLMEVKNFGKVVVNALDNIDLQVFCIALYRVLAKGKNFLFRSAADFVKAVGGIGDRELLGKEEMIGSKNKRGGIIVVGSHTAKTTEQLNQLNTFQSKALQSKEIAGLEFIEFNSDLVLEDGLEEEVKRVVAESERLIENGRSVVIYTKRKLLSIEGDTKEQALLRSVKISEAVQRLVGDLNVEPAFVIAKGGITSSDIGVKALRVKKALVLGQAQPGIPVWKTDDNSKFPGIPYIIFPGNVGDADTLKKIVEKLVSI